jgi:hypothetical protein
MRHRRDERRIRLVEGVLLCHGHVSSAVDVRPGDSRCSVAPRRERSKRSGVRGVASLARAPISGAAFSLEPAPPAPIAAATQNQ